MRVEDAAEQASNLLGIQFTRLIASSGFQLVNVNNVAIQLKVRGYPSSCHFQTRLLKTCDHGRIHCRVRNWTASS